MSSVCLSLALNVNIYANCYFSRDCQREICNDPSITCLPSYISTLTNICKQALIDGPKNGASRQVISFSHLTLLPIVLPKFPRGARTGTVAKKWESADVEGKFKQTRHAKQISVREKRSGLSDFERFVVARLKKQVFLFPYEFG